MLLRVGRRLLLLTASNMSVIHAAAIHLYRSHDETCGRLPPWPGRQYRCWRGQSRPPRYLGDRGSVPHGPSVTNKAKAQYYPNEGVVWRIRWNCGRQASVHGSQSHRRGDCRGSHVAARRHSISAGCCHSHDDDDDVDDSDPPSPPLPLKWRDLYTLARCRLQAPHKTKQSKDLLYQQINSTISSSTYH